MTKVKYMGDEPCWTQTPSLDWQPGQEIELSPEEVAILTTNDNFKVVTAAPPSRPAPAASTE